MARGRKQRKVGSVVYDFRANLAQFMHGTDKAKASLRSLKRQAKQIGTDLKRFAVAATATGVALGVIGKVAARDVNELIKLSKALRTNVADLQVMERAAELAGSSFDNMQTALRRMEINMGQLAGGNASQKLNETWERLRINISDIMNLPVDRRWEEIAQAIRQYIPAAEQAAAAAQIFGARADLELLGMDPETIRQARQGLDELGGGMSRIATRDVDLMVKSVKETGFTLRNLTRDLIAQHAPAIREFADEIRKSLEPGGQLRTIIVAISDAAGTAARALKVLVDQIKDIITDSGALIASWALITGAAVQLVRALHSLYFIMWNSAAGAAALAAANGTLKAGLISLMGVWKALLALPFLKLIAIFAGIGAAIHVLHKAFTDWGAENITMKRMLDQHRDAARALSDEYKGMAGVMKQASTGTRELYDAKRQLLRASLAEMEHTANRIYLETRESSRFKKLMEDRAQIDSWRAQARQHRLIADTVPIQDSSQMSLHRAKNRFADELEAQFKADMEELMAPYNSLMSAINETTDALRIDYLGPPINVEQMNNDAEKIRKKIAAAMPGVTTSTFDSLRQAKDWHDQVTDEIGKLKGDYSDLQASADEAYEAMKRHAQGLYSTMENLTMVIDGIKDQFRSVTDSIVDHMIDGTTKISDAFKKMAIQIAKDMIWMQVRSGLSAVGSHIMGGIGSSLFGGQIGPLSIRGQQFGGSLSINPFPGANPILASGGTVNANSLPRFARGGFHKGGPMIVGENGAEIVDTGPARVYDANTTRRMLGANITLEARLSGDVTAIAEQIRNQVGEAAGPLAQELMSGVTNQLRLPSDMRTAAKDL